MMGRLKSDQGQLFYKFHLGDAVPEDHLVRKIDTALDLSWLRSELAPHYSSMGGPSIDPELMIRMLVVGYVFAIRSERLICREVQVNLAYRWFCKLGIEDAVPDHSAFSRARNERFREGDVFRHVFERVVEACIAAGLVGGEGFAVDASLIQADANKQRSIAGQDWRRDRDPARSSRAVSFIANIIDHRRILLLVPDPTMRPLGYARIRSLITETLKWPIPPDCTKADAFMLDHNGMPIPLTLKRGPKGKSGLKPWMESIVSHGNPKFAPAAGTKYLPKEAQAFPPPAPNVARKDFEPKTLTFSPREVGPWDAVNNSAFSFIDTLKQRTYRQYCGMEVLHIIGAIALLAFVSPSAWTNINGGNTGVAVVTGGLSVVGLAWLTFRAKKILELLSLRTHPIGRALARRLECSKT